MGQENSVPRRRRSLRSLFSKRNHHKSVLSHAVRLPNDDQRIHQLNVNLATEEELMTLSGIVNLVPTRTVFPSSAVSRSMMLGLGAFDIIIMAGSGSLIDSINPFDPQGRLDNLPRVPCSVLRSVDQRRSRSAKTS